MPPTKPQPKKPSKIFISSTSSSSKKNLKQCTPNLMPFSISYNGTAPISTYMRVEKAKSNVGGPEFGHVDIGGEGSKCDEVNVEKGTVEEGEDKMCVESESQDTVVESSNEDFIEGKKLDTEEAVSLADTTLVMQIPPVDTNMSATSSSSSSSSSSSTLASTSALQSRFTSTFRGRTIQGLEVGVPEGYTGVVFRSDRDDDTGGKGSKVPVNSAPRKKVEKGKGRARKGINEDYNKRSSRTTRSARSKVIEVEVEPEEESELDEDDMEGTEMVDPNDALHLIPSSEFSSFVLWHPDLPVDTGKDEYLAALGEWMKIAQVIHQVPS